MAKEQGPFRRPKIDQRLAFSSGSPRYLSFGWAYLEAAKVLGSQFEDLRSEMRVIAPIIFLYRHALEMSIKGYLIDFGDEIVSKADVRARSHSLKDQLPDFRTLASSIGFELSADLEKYIESMHDRDPRAMDWRYPEDMKGNETSGIKEYDTEHFFKLSARVFDEFDNLGWALSGEQNRRFLQDLGVLDYDPPDDDRGIVKDI